MLFEGGWRVGVWLGPADTFSPWTLGGCEVMVLEARGRGGAFFACFLPCSHVYIPMALAITQPHSPPSDLLAPGASISRGSSALPLSNVSTLRPLLTPTGLAGSQRTQSAPITETPLSYAQRNYREHIFLSEGDPFDPSYLPNGAVVVAPSFETLPGCLMVHPGVFVKSSTSYIP